MGGIGALTGLVTTGLSLMGGAQQRKRAAEAEAKGDIFESYNQLIQSKQGFVKAAQTNEAMTQQLSNVIANIKAIRASAGTETSPTEHAIVHRTQALGGQDISRSVRRIEEQAEQNQAAFEFYQQSAKDALSSFSGIF